MAGIDETNFPRGHIQAREELGRTLPGAMIQSIVVEIGYCFPGNSTGW